MALRPTQTSHNTGHETSHLPRSETGKRDEIEETAGKFRQQFEQFQDTTELARTESEIDRDYKDNKQWSEEEIRKLARRNQAAIVVNRIKPKVEGMKGLVSRKKNKPKAFPRTQKHEKSAEAITDALRYIYENVDFHTIRLLVAEDVFVQGYGGTIIGVKRKGKEPTITVDHIPWDRIYFDPHTRRQDFKDAMYMGMVVWLDREVAENLYPDADIDSMMVSVESTTFDDKPIWIDSKRNRIKICHHFYQKNNVWRMCVFSSDFLVKPKDSPFLDEDGEPSNPIELVGAYIDRDLQRFGEVRYWRDLQDEINHRRSKFLFLNSSRQTTSRRGAITDVDEMKRELAKPDGHVQYDGEKGDFDTLDTTDMSAAQFQLLQHSEGQLDAVSFNAQLAGDVQGNQSGVAVDLLQQASTLELSPLYASIEHWELRNYRQFWSRIKQFWDGEKWIRVTDDYANLKWVGLNHKVTMGQMMQEIAEDEAEDPARRQEASKMLQQMTENQDPRLSQVQEMRNNVAELDIDIILQTAPDSVNIQREQFEILANIASGRPEAVPTKVLLKLSEFRDKDELIAEIDKAEADAAQQTQQAQQLEQQAIELKMQTEQLEVQIKQQDSDAKAAKLLAETERIKVEKLQKEIENLILLANPDQQAQVFI